MTRTFIGIDPGMSGGIGVIIDGGGTFSSEAFPMPETERDIWDLFESFRNTEKYPNATAVIEKVGVMPGQGISSGFKFGQGYGALRMALIGNKIPYIDVTPAKWQQAVGIAARGEKSKTEHKNVLKAKAQREHPHLKITLKTADAVLLAGYLKAI